ncbi:MAG: polysaccharide biosynthesis tyrosine autokinase [Phycisphaeraceae bacterium]|nr:polysaccharide biosynthesis tyrosine autokinase [Phycisphaeraceae bacterium]
MGYIFEAMNRWSNRRPEPLSEQDSPAPQEAGRAQAPETPAVEERPSEPAPAAVTSTVSDLAVDDAPKAPARKAKSIRFPRLGAPAQPKPVSEPVVITAEAPAPRDQQAEPSSNFTLRVAEAEPAPDVETQTSDQPEGLLDRIIDSSSRVGRTHVTDEICSRSDSNIIDDRLVALVKPASLIAEEYRGVRTSLLARWEQKRKLVHVITSATPQEGKTITSLNLGLSLAELRNRRTIVIEADLRLPQFSRLLWMPQSPGLVGYLEEHANLADVVHAVGKNNLHVIPAGAPANDRAVQLLSSPRMAELVKQLRTQYDHVIIDTPPIIDLADAGILGALADEVLLIVRMNRTPRPLVEQAVKTLSSYNAPLAAIIATDQRAQPGSYYKYGRYGRYGGYGGYGTRHYYAHRKAG